MYSLKDKVIMITGGYGHLGTAISKALVENGAQVIVLGRSRQKFDQKFGGSTSNIHFQECDIQETSSIAGSFKSVADQYGKIDGLINNAFYVRGNNPEAISDEDWQYSINGCLDSVYKCIREVIPYLEAAGGSIINVSSMYGMVAPDFNVYKEFEEFTNPPHYGAAKAGVIQLTKYFASRLAPKKIRVNAVSPGAFPSEPVQEKTGFIDNLEAKIPLGRIGSPEDLGGVFVLLASDASAYITGQNIAVDGGWTIV